MPLRFFGFAEMEAGCVLDQLRCCAEHYHLTFAPDPSTHSHNTLGGMIGNNSCGVHSLMGGRTTDNVQSLDVLTYDGLRTTVATDFSAGAGPRMRYCAPPIIAALVIGTFLWQ